MPDIQYPTCCEIIDADGDPLTPGFVCRTPEVSRPHIGKHGLAEEIADPDSLFGFTIRITLDDGAVLYGYECWWKPINA